MKEIYRTEPITTTRPERPEDVYDTKLNAHCLISKYPPQLEPSEQMKVCLQHRRFERNG